MDVDDIDPAVQIQFRNLRLDGTFSRNQRKPLEIGLFLHSLLVEWQNVDPDLKIRDVNGNNITLDQF